jgi:excisionase family DNA binding protein
MPKCIAYDDEGKICGKPATVFDRQRGGLVCAAHAPQDFQERYLSADDIAAQIKMSALTVRKWLRSGKLKGVRAGRLWRVKESDLHAFLERNGAPAKQKRAPGKKTTS